MSAAQPLQSGNGRKPDDRPVRIYRLSLTRTIRYPIYPNYLNYPAQERMGLLDALAKSALGEARPPASMLFYGRETFHVEHHPRNRVNQWRPWVEARRFGIVALGYSRPGELESQLVERLDQIALREVRRFHARADVESGDVLITLHGAGFPESISKQRSPSEAASAIAQMLEQSELTAMPWEQFILLILTDVVATWNCDRVIEAVLDDDAASETALPNGMAPELLNRYEKTREGAVKEFGLLRSEDLARAIHSTAGNVSLVASKWRRKGEIFAVSYGGKPGYFAFQFDPMTGRPKAVIAKIIQAFPPNTDGWRLALWLVSANPRLANRRPVDVLDRNPEQVIEAAKAENRVELF
jgi:hypothetical protein